MVNPDSLTKQRLSPLTVDMLKVGNNLAAEDGRSNVDARDQAAALAASLCGRYIGPACISLSTSMAVFPCRDTVERSA
jgi:hypothetical protein